MEIDEEAAAKPGTGAQHQPPFRVPKVGTPGSTK